MKYLSCSRPVPDTRRDMSLKGQIFSPLRLAAVLLLEAALVINALPSLALADDNELEQLEEAAISAGEEYQNAQEELDKLNEQIEENEARITEIEEQLPEHREKCAEAIRSSYKMQQGQPGLVALLLSAEDFNEFLTMAGYLDSMNKSNIDDIEQLVEMQDELKQTRSDLEQQRADVEKKADQAREAADEAEKAAEAARKKALENAAAAEAAYKAQQEAQKQSQQESQQSPQSNDQANDIPQVSEPQPSAPSGNTSGDWIYVGASTYGIGDGFLWGTTASGDIVTPTSMGVAMKTVPLGTTIEITYNGRTCTAVVNDRGPFVGGREIDLQPAVANALGFSGVGTVGYRIIG